MNTVFRIVWNMSRGQSMVTSELAKRRSKARDGRVRRALVTLGLVTGVGLVSSVYAYTAADADACANNGFRDTRIAIGANAEACSNGQIAIGWKAGEGVKDGSFTVAIGQGAKAKSVTNLDENPQYGVAIGRGAGTSGGVAIGHLAKGVESQPSTAIGTASQATGNYSIAIGTHEQQRTVASGFGATAVGSFSRASGQNSVSLGRRTQAVGRNAVSIGLDSVSRGFSALALGESAKASHDHGVALGSGSVTAKAVGTDGATIRGIDYKFAGTSPDATVSVGKTGGERTVTNVAAGRLSKNSTDAINGSQLFATNQAIEDVSTVAQAGWNLSAQDNAATNVAPGDELNLRNTDGNLTVSRSAVNGRQQVSFNLANDVAIDDSLTVEGDTVIEGDTQLGDNFHVTNNEVTYDVEPDQIDNDYEVTNKKYVDDAGDALVAKGLNFSGNAGDEVHRDLGQTLAITGGASADGTYSGDNLKTLTDPATGAIQLQMAEQPQFGDVVINADDSGRISGVADGQDGDDAVNLSQLNDVSDVASAGWNLTAQGENESNVAPDETVDLNNGDGNIVVSKADDSDDVTFDLANDITIGDSLTVEGDTHLGDNFEVVNNEVHYDGPINDDTHIVNKQYVDDLGDAGAGGGFGLAGAGDVEVQESLGETIKVYDPNGDIVTTADNANGELQLSLSNDLSFGGPGADGEDGEDGYIGVDGADGESGVGINGADGSIGLTGPSGADGKSPALTLRPGIEPGDVVADDTEVTRLNYEDGDGNNHTVATLEDDGLRFSGNDNSATANGEYLTRQLNEAMPIVGGAQATNADGSAAEYSADNVKTVASQAGGLEIQFAESPSFGGDLTVEGDTVIEGDTTVEGDTHLGDNFEVVNNEVHYDGPIDDDTHIVNKQYVDDLGDAGAGGGFGLADAGDIEIQESLGETIKVYDPNGDIVTTADNANGELQLSLSNDLSFGGSGADGEDGEDGYIGVDGADGESGVGINGADGSIGLTGPAGADGKSPALTLRPGIEQGDVVADDTEVTRLNYEDGDGNNHTVATLEDDGLRFSGNDNSATANGEYLTRQLNEAMPIVGGAQATNADGSASEYSADNVKTVATQDGGLEIQFAESPSFGGDLTVEGDTHLGDNFEVVNNEVHYDGPINDDTHIVNKQYVDDLGDAGAGGGFGLADAGDVEVQESLGETIKVYDPNGDIVTTADNANGELQLSLSNDLSFGGPGADGEDGEDGYIGVDGADGESGVGINGADGSIGLTGPAGADGKSPALTLRPGIEQGDVVADDTEVTRLNYEDGDGNNHTVATLEDDGLRFSGNDNSATANGEYLTRQLNEAMPIVGGAQATNADGSASEYSADNVKTVASQDGGLEIQFAESPSFGGDLTVEGDTHLGDNFEVVNNEVHYDGPINDDTHIVNKQYVDESGDELVAEGLNFAGNTGDEVHRDLGQTLAITGEAATDGNYSGANLKTLTDPATGAIQLQITDQPQFGDVVINDGGSGKITGVTAGTDDTDAVNVSQLNDVSNMVNAGWDLSVQDGEATNVAPNGEVNLRNSDGNLSVTQASADDREQVTFNLSDEVTIGSSLTINEGPTLDGDGIDMGGDTITNLGDPVNEGDAINLDYFNENRAHYFSYNDDGIRKANYANDGAVGTDSLAIGVGASTGRASERALALGYNTRAVGMDSIAIGQYANAAADGAVAIGRDATANGGQSISIGYGNIATGNGAVSIGDPSEALGDGAVVLGKDNTAEGTGAVSVGNNNSSKGDGSMAIGDTNVADGGGAMAIGDGNTSTGTGSITMGVNNKATGDGAVAMGNNNVVSGDGAFAVGNNATSGALDTLALGTRASATAQHAMALGNDSDASGFASFAAGNTAEASGDRAMALGQFATASGSYSAAIGLSANSSAEDSLSVGNHAEASGLRSSAIGNSSMAAGQGASALGSNANAEAYGSLALGARSDALHESSVALGAATETVRGAQADYTGYGKNATEDSVGEIAIAQVARFDDEGNQLTEAGNRQITGVAAGVEDTDAVNVSQLAAIDQKAELAIQGWSLSAQGANSTSVASGDSLDLSNTDGNLVIAKNADDGTEESVTFDLSDNVTIGDSLTVEGDTYLGDHFKVENNEAHYDGPIEGDTSIVNKQYVDDAGGQLTSKGLNFTGNEGDEIHRDLGATLAVTGEAATDGTYSGNNLKTVTDPESGEIALQMSDQPQFGDVTINEGDNGKITGVTDGDINETSSDVVNGSQLWALEQTLQDGQQVHYYSVNDGGTQGGNFANDGATGVGAIASGVDASASAEGAIAMGAGATASDVDSVALGAGATTEAAVGTESITIDSQTYNFAGTSPIGTLSIGSAGAERTITHVAAGRVSATSTDAINGSQLHATNRAVENVDNRVTNVEGDVTELGDRVTNVEGDVQNLGDEITQLGDQAVKYDLHDDGSVNYNSVTLEGDEGTTITNVADGDISETSSDTVNGSQLWKVQQQISKIEVGETKYFKANSEAADAHAAGAESVAMGPESVAEGDHSVAAGDGAVARSEGGVALGAGSQATREGLNGAEEAFSSESVASTQGAVSVGSEGGERQITHVAGGTQATDAVNVRQLQAVQDASVNYDRHEDGSVDYSSVTLGEEGSPTQIHNVAAGEVSTDAANVGQLEELNQHFNRQIGGLHSRIDDVEDDANAGTASALAAASVPQAYLPGKSMISAGAGTYNGQSAVAVGVSRLSDNGRWAVKLNATGDSQGNFGAGVGAGFHW